MSIRVAAYGDSALLVTSTHVDRERRWRTVHRLAALVRVSGIPGVETVLPTYDTLLVEYDPARIDMVSLQAALRQVEDDASSAAVDPEPRTWRIPVVYGGEFGPDLLSVAADLGLTADEVIARHADTTWHVAFNGAPAGAPMHEGSAFPAPVSRMPAPRLRVPAGSVAVSGRQGVIYAVDAPGGWRLIGRTPLRLVSPGRENPLVIAPGDSLRYRPITAAEFAVAEGRLLGEADRLPLTDEHSGVRS